MRRLLLSALLCATLAASAMALGDGKVHLYAVDVGQGDAILLIGPAGTSCLVDGGPSNSSSTNISEAMNDAIAAGLTDSTLDYIVVSHFHTDHMYALDEVYNLFPGGLNAAYDRGGSYSSTAYTQYNNFFGTSGLNKRTNARTFSLDSATMTYLGRGGSNSTSDENNNGVLYRLDYGDFQASLLGDLGGSYEAAGGQKCGVVEFYKVNHHGSATSSQTTFLSYITPIAHVFSYGVGNSYGHPTAAAIDRLNAIGSARYDTKNHAQGGPYVHVESDGVSGFSVNNNSYALHGGGSATPTPTPSPTPTLTPSPTPTPAGDVPAAPSSLTATAVSRTQINLTWSDNSNNEANFVVERKKGTGSYSVIATLGANTTAYSSTGLSKNTTYTYRVKATNASGSSAYSNEATAKTPR